MKTKNGTMRSAVANLAEWCRELRDSIREEIHHHGDEDSERRGRERIAAIGRDIAAARDAAKRADAWQTVAEELAGAVDSMLTQMDQMEGAFDDEDGTIADAMDAGVEALESLHRIRGGAA